MPANEKDANVRDDETLAEYFQRTKGGKQRSLQRLSHPNLRTESTGDAAPRVSSALGRGIASGHIDRASGEECGWANGAMTCRVPDCKFSEERCILVQRLRQERSW